MRKVYFHIGFGKTGSSSLQAYLSLNPTLQSGKDEKLLYCCFQKDGTVISGDQITEGARATPLKYLSSLPDAAEWLDASLAKNNLDDIFQQGFTPVFSQEDWGRRAGHFKNSKLFDQLDIDVYVIVYVRPQVEWFNSAWWQWFAWSEKFTTPTDVINAWGYRFMQWGAQIGSWKRQARVKGVIVRLMPSDVVLDFQDVMQISGAEQSVAIERSNVSLSPILIKLLKKYPYLRSTHSADVDLILSRYLKFDGKTPWVLDQEIIEKVINATHEDNINLLNMLDPVSRQQMLDDRKWWDTPYYENRKVWEEQEFQLTEVELQKVIGQILPALIELGRKQTSY